MIDLSIIIPAFNESENVPSIVAAFNEYSKMIGFSTELVFVDDGSMDNSFELLRKSSFACKKTVVKLSRNFGSHAAIRAGISVAKADNCIIYYMDMSEPISCIEEFYGKLKEGYDVVYSDRKNYKASMGSRIFAKLVTQFIEKDYPENGVSIIAFNKKIKDELNKNIENNSSIFFQIFQMGFQRYGMPVIELEREKGTSKWNLSKKIKLFIDSFVMFSYMPIRAISVFGMILAAIGFICAVIIVICKVSGVFSFSVGWPTMSCLLLLGFGVTNVSLGIISEYLVRTLDASRERPVFIIDEVSHESED